MQSSRRNIFIKMVVDRLTNQITLSPFHLHAQNRVGLSKTEKFLLCIHSCSSHNFYFDQLTKPIKT